VGHDWHTGLVVSAKAITARVPGLRARFGPAAYLEFGWGDRGFYQAPQVDFGLAAHAIAWPTDTVLHVVEIPVSPRVSFARSQVRLLCTSQMQQRALLDFIARSFARGPGGEISALGRGIYGNSEFFAATGTYHLFNTCNSWTAKGLKSLGIDMAASSTFTAERVMDQLAAQDLGDTVQSDCSSASSHGHAAAGFDRGRSTGE
jgi:uncharacterized protein (TIGR02117 family)